MKTQNLHTDINYLPRTAASYISGFFTGFSSWTSSRTGDSTFLSANSAGAVALEITATLRNGDPGGASGVTAPLEFVTQKTQVSDLLIDEFISDNLLDECVINATGADNVDNKITDIVSISVSKERPAGTMRGFAEGTLGAPSAISIASRVLFSWLRRSPVRACLSWRAERLARNLFSVEQNLSDGNTSGGFLKKSFRQSLRAIAKQSHGIVAGRLPRRPAVAELLAMTISTMTFSTMTCPTIALAARKFTARFIAEICNRMSVINHNLSRPWGLHYRPQFL